jgi:hypothetical protein
MIFDNKRITNYSLVSIPVPAAGAYSNFNFPDQPQLRGRKIEKISLYTAAQIAVSPDGMNVTTGVICEQCWLVLYINGREDIKLPLLSLINLTSNSVSAYVNANGYIPLNDVQIIWEKSYIKAPGTVGFLTGNNAFIMGVFYK